VTHAICYRDAYARSIEATVVSAQLAAEGTQLVVLDRTVFYPGGGGQPSDTGSVTTADGRRLMVRGIQRVEAELGHQLEPGGETPAIGDRVTVAIDWDRRYLLMRTHTALHTLCGVVWRDYQAQVTGGNMEPGRGRLDFEFESLTGDMVGTIEARVNQELARARAVHVRVLARDEAFAIPDLIRTKVNLLPEGITEVRVIEIEGLDLQADGGTHVANTSEVGPIRVAGYESKGRINKRIRIELAG
jgi:misacylated tRNA(Ala) deacylase